ncbi:unnamed protein product [Nyctereutes procyonoides]|uniref:(raccoon dog) hypothetical protein n=1 Tax=Nyctereutes procyonoides TaxID=34880 RepID=A0A811ZYP8_NYCPR|nr:unnamed protein product [Nyctereutes procyonoides]
MHCSVDNARSKEYYQLIHPTQDLRIPGIMVLLFLCVLCGPLGWFLLISLTLSVGVA